MSRQNHVRWMGVVGVALVVAVAVSTAGAAGRPRSALDEVERPHRPPEVQTIVLRFVHIPAESFVDTLEQLARNPKLRERLEQMPMAVNEPANAVVLIAPPEVAAVFARVADELDQPNEFLMHEREREVEEAATRLRLEAAKRHLAQPVPPPMAARGRGPRMEPGRGGPPSQAARPRQPLAPRVGQPGREGRKQAPRAERPGRPPTPHEHEQAQRHRREHRERLEAEQRKLHEMLEHHRHDAEKHMEELERKKQHMMEEHRRQMGERGDRVPPPEREAREHALHEHLEAMERAQDQIRETIEREQHQLQDRLEDIERQKHRLMEESPGPMPRHEEARRPEAEHDEHRPPVRRRGPEGEPPHRGSAGMDSLLGWLLGPRAREALGFSDDQVERIGDLVRHVREHVKEVWQGLRDKMNRAGPEAREHIAREMREQMTRRWAEHRRDVMERLGQILRPDQRQRLRGWLREHGPAERPGPREQEPPGRPHEDRPSGRKGPHHPADETQAPMHRLM